MSIRAERPHRACRDALLLGVVGVLFGCVPSADVRSPRRQAVEAGLLPAVVPVGQPLPAWRIEARMARYRVPGVGIAVIDGGRIAWAAGYGVTRAAGGRAVSASTSFQAASLSKMVAAAGALRLVQDGKLDLDVDVDRHLRAWKIPAGAATAAHPVTLRALLSHTAGVTVGGFAGYAEGDALPDLRQILDGAPPANSPPIRVDLAPGTRYRYSGGGYQIVQQLVEDASGQPFARAMRQRVLDPAGMSRSAYRPPQADRDGDVACGHGYDGAPVPGCANRYPELAAAGLWSTPSDLARFGLALSDAVRGRRGALLDRTTATAMLTEVKEGAGLGPGVQGAGDALRFSHAGANRGFRSDLVVYPQRGQGVVVMANGDGADALIDEIVRAVARAYGWPDFAPQRRVVAVLDAAALDARAGDYEVPEYGLVLSVRREGDHLVVATPRGSWYSFYPAGAGAFFAIEDGASLTFADAAAGGRPTLQVWDMTAQRRAER